VDAAAAAHPEGRLPADEMVQLLARLKAEAGLDAAVLADAGLAPAEVDGFILGGDSAFELDGTVYGKPHEPAIARERWLAQRGRSGVLHSGHWLVDHRGGRVNGAVGRASRATVHFADDIETAEIDAYIATGEPLKVAGAFTIDAKGAGFIDRIEGDPHTVVGLSVPLLRKLVHELGGRWTDLWNR
ncbi:MAG: Maf family protein, partial [Microbacteriaceae bacterium]|nr:Maf family protein [Microbacteriaceae bacterium]